MFNDISLQLVSILYVVVLATVYFVKRRYNFLESKIYKFLLGVTFFNLLLDIVNIFINNTNILFVVSILYCLGLFFWLILFISYLLLSMSNKKYENFKLLIKDHPVVYSIINAIIIIFLVLILSQNLFGFRFVNYYNRDINIIYVFGIISSLIIMFVLLINNKKIANYKNWSILVSTFLLVLMLFIQIYYPNISIIGGCFENKS